jgi:hypothetical protein
MSDIRVELHYKILNSSSDNEKTIVRSVEGSCARCVGQFFELQTLLLFPIHSSNNQRVIVVNPSPFHAKTLFGFTQIYGEPLST